MHSIGCSNRAIARELNCSPSTIVYDQKRHCIPLYRQCETIQSCPGTNAIDAKAAVRACSFIEASSSTVDLVLMDIKSIYLPEKVKRNTKARRVRANKRILGRNIDERSPRIDNRKDFGHWECDLVLGTRPRMIMCCLLRVNERHVASS